MQLEIPIRRRGREPPKPAASSTAGSSDDPREGWQLHHSSNGLPFYFNRMTGESVWARTSTGTAEEPRGADDGARAAFKPFALAPSRSAAGSSCALVPSGGIEVPSSSSLESDSTESSNSPTSRSTTSGDSTSHDNRSHFSPQSSSQSDKSSDDSWTGSMERKFRRLVRSEQGRVMLKSEVQVLAARVSRRGHKRPLTGVRKRARRALSNAGQDPGKDDVEMALLLPTDTDNERTSSSSESSSSSGSTSTSGTSSSSGSSSNSGSSSMSSFSLHMSSSAGSDISLLTEDVLLERLERVEKTLVVTRDALLRVLHASLGVARQTSLFVWTAVRQAAALLRRRRPGRPTGRSP